MSDTRFLCDTCATRRRSAVRGTLAPHAVQVDVRAHLPRIRGSGAGGAGETGLSALSYFFNTDDTYTISRVRKRS